MSPQIVVVGSLNMDLVVHVPRFPSAGETVGASDLQMIPGGKGANQAAAASRLGAKVAMVGRVGRDGFGDTLIRELGQIAVETVHIGRDEAASTGVALITVDPLGQNEIVVVPGANARLEASHVDAAEQSLTAAQILIVQLETPMATVAHALALAARHHLITMLNAAPAKSLSPDLLRAVGYLIVNESECQLLSGLEIVDPKSACKAARHLLEQGPGAVVVTLGARGALLVDDRGEVGFEAPVVPVVDSTAAGDAFIGGLALPLLEGTDPRQALPYAICAGSLAVTKDGAQSSLPSASEVKTLCESKRLPPLRLS
jgi:ribokinase